MKLRFIVRLIGTAIASALLLVLPYLVNAAPVRMLTTPFFAPGLAVIVFLTPLSNHVPYLAIIAIGLLVNFVFTWLVLMLLATATERYIIRKREHA